MNFNFWRNKRVLITGHTGFKGSWLLLLLNSLGCKLAGCALPPKTPNDILFEPDDFFKKNLIYSEYFNITKFSKVRDFFENFEPEIVFHLAAQPLVLDGYSNPLQTVATNVTGTVNVLEVIRGIGSVKAVISVTTDKVYKTDDAKSSFNENDHLGGSDPYSASKASADILSECYRSSFLEPKGIGVAVARAGNVIGGGDWSKDRLLPDIVRAVKRRNPIYLRHPSAVRPWQHVMDPLHGYLRLAEKVYTDPMKYSGAFNFGPSDQSLVTVSQLANMFVSSLGVEADIRYSQNHHWNETQTLTLNTEKASKVLNFNQRYDTLEAVLITAEWYRAFMDGACPISLTEKQLTQY